MTVGAETQLEIAPRETWFDRLVARWHARRETIAYHGLISIADQFVFSGTRFVTSIIVGRACGPAELGDYTLGFTLLCVAVCVQGSLISMPFTIYRNLFEEDEQREFSGSTLAHCAALGFLIMVVFGLVSGALALGYGPPALAPLVAILGITVPLALLVEFARRFALARFEVMTVFVLDVLMSAVQVIGLLALAWMGALSAGGAYLAMGLGAGLAGLAWLASSRRMFVIRRARLFADAVRNFRSGRWSVINQLTLTARPAIALWLLALDMDATLVGIYAACDTLTRMSSPLLAAVCNLQFPRVSQAFSRGNMAQARRVSYQAALVLLLATALFFVFVAWLGEPVLAKLYGAAYSGQAAVLIILALAQMADSIDSAATFGLLGIDRPNATFFASLWGTLAILAVSAALVPGWGMVGAAAGSLVGRCITPALQWWALLRMTSVAPARRPA